MSPFVKLIAAIVAVAAALCAGLYLGGHPEHLPRDIRAAFVEDERAVRAEILETIEESFYRDVDRDELDQASYKGMIRHLEDRFSHYFTPDEADIFEQSVSGRFEGVGMTVQEHERGLLVASVFEDSPAEEAGIKKDDLIVRVNGESIAGEPTDIATAKIKGKPGTSVRLTVVDGASEKRRTIEVERASIEIPVVEAEMVRRGDRSVAVVRLLSFTSGAHGAVREELERLIERGADGVLLDLRGNGGGLLREAVLVSSVFMEDGTVVTTRGRARPEREFEAEGKAPAAEIPVVVMIDRGSASASEIVAGALRDRRSIPLVGERTFGKGFFQEVEPLSNGGALDLTVGRYFLPSGKGISRKGISPDVRARDDPETDADEGQPAALDVLFEKLR